MIFPLPGSIAASVKLGGQKIGVSVIVGTNVQGLRGGRNGATLFWQYPDVRWVLLGHLITR